ncbi:hypothetical protein [Streptomyces sp. NPDC020965]|uniref:hypothetical protein n=1 Tax=Streptomyces sp. NPDC020965 TaxID=3365105 RepID=UPI00378F2AC9
MRRSTGRALAVFGAVAVLGVTFPPGAHAATGEFVYHTQPGNVPHTLTDPRDGDCYPVGRRVQGRTVNNTDRRAVMYVEKNCRNATAEELDPGQWTENSTFMSVRFTV